MSNALRGFDATKSLSDINDAGVAVIQAALDEPALNSFARMLDTLNFRTPPADALPATTACQLCLLHSPFEDWPLINRTVDELTACVTTQGSDIAGLRQWRPNEVFVRRYDSTSTGMDLHRDGVRFWYLISTITLTGSAIFVQYDNSGLATRQWKLQPGDLVLLRGAYLGGSLGERPLHSVTGPVGEPRCSIAFRYNAQPPLARRRIHIG